MDIMRQKSWKKTSRPLTKISPIAASFVRSENAFKIPRESGTQRPTVRQEAYDLDGYNGPVPGALNEVLVASDLMKYSELKGTLIRNSALAGLFGTIIAQLAKGTEDAIVYALGAAAGVFYLYFLDTLGSAEAKLGKNISNVRFAAPIMVFVAIALFNKSLGDANPMADSKNIFALVTPEQYGAAVLGFLTYRIPLFGGQIAEFLKDGKDELVLPGSAGIAMKLAKGDTTDGKKQGDKILDTTLGLTPIIVVSGPPLTGRHELVQKLIRESDSRFVGPMFMDRGDDGATFERLEQRGDFLEISESGRYGLTRDGILKAGTAGTSVVVVDADVALAKKLSAIPTARLIGVWVGLDSVAKFQTRLQEKVDSGEISIPEDETRESIVRAKIREIVRDIEYGIVSGVFEFTILNDDPEDSLMQLKAAAEYSFK
jgi:guanylate kinase